MAQDLAEYLELDWIGQALNLAQPWLLGSKSPSAFKALGEIHAARRTLERLRQFIVEALRAAVARELETASMARVDGKEDNQR